MNLRRLKWLTILTPIAFFATIEVMRNFLFESLMSSWPGYVLLLGIVLLGALFFSEAVFSFIDRAQLRSEKINRELLSLHEAGLEISRNLELEDVLERVVHRARELVGARYGAIAFLNEDNQTIAAFLTSGISPELRELLGPLPDDHGMLGDILRQGEPYQTEDLTRDPRAVGFPPHHPPMHSMLVVPIETLGEVVGNLYVTEKKDAAGFSEDDKTTLERLATVAGIAIENARLHRRVRAVAMTEERERIAREIHDSVAQVLGYVNTKAQAATALLRAEKLDDASTQIDQLGAAARESYADVREHILGLRNAATIDRGIRETIEEYLQRWQEQSGIAVNFVVEPEDFTPALTQTTELQLLRIIQEGLSNARKHSKATVVVVNLEQEHRWVTATVEDNGTGFDPAATQRRDYPRFGLSTMRERAEAVGGSLEIDSRPNQGTTVRVRIPEDRRGTLASSGLEESLRRGS